MSTSSLELRQCSHIAEYIQLILWTRILFQITGSSLFAQPFLTKLPLRDDQVLCYTGRSHGHGLSMYIYEDTAVTTHPS